MYVCVYVFLLQGRVALADRRLKYKSNQIKSNQITMMSKNKNGHYSVTLYGRSMERLAFCYDKHEEITRYIFK